MHALFKARQYFVLANRAEQKLVSFLSCLVPLKGRLFINNVGHLIPATRCFGQVPLAANGHVTVAFKGHFVPSSFRFKVMGGKRQANVPISKISISSLRQDSSIWSKRMHVGEVIDAKWCSPFLDAPYKSCVFRFEFASAVTLTDFQMRGASRELFWAVPFWRFLMGEAMYSQTDARVKFWDFVVSGPKSSAISRACVVEEADFSALAAVVTSNTASDAWKSVAVKAMFLAINECPARTSTSSACDLLGQCSRAKLDESVVGPLIWFFSSISRLLSSDLFNGSFLVFVQSKLASFPTLSLKLKSRLFEHIFDFVDTSGLHCPYLISFVSFLCSSKDSEVKRFLALLLFFFFLTFFCFRS